MASIIRSPDMSQERRKLSTRRTREIVAQAAADAPAAPSAPAGAPAPPVSLPQGAAPSPVTQPAPASPAPDIKALVEQARASVLEQFKAEAEKARELGRQRGLQEGRLSGAEEARKHFEADLARVRSIATKLREAVDTQIHGVEDIAVSIAFEAICRVLGDAAVTREGITALVRQAATHATHTERIVARLHPADLQALRDTGGLDETLSSGVAVSWVADERVVMGGCIVETDSGELDARLETQVDRLRAVLVAARRGVAADKPLSAG
jgi:flagellar assembly protein FliH